MELPISERGAVAKTAAHRCARADRVFAALKPAAAKFPFPILIPSSSTWSISAGADRRN
jgi:hypothetical protein